MEVPSHLTHPLVVIALVLAAVVGFLAGNHRGGAGAGTQAGPLQVANTRGMLVEYPVGWQRSASPKSIPGLTLSEAVTLTPRGSSGSGLLSGMVPPGEPAPLPKSFLARLTRPPHVEVVLLVSTQAYRYSAISLPGYHGVLVLYAIPAPGEGTRLMACFAPQRLTAAGEECERVVANVTLTGTTDVTLTPSAAYASALARRIGKLDAARAKERGELGQSASAAAVVAPARALAAGFESAASSVSALEAPAPAAAAQVALSQSLSTAGKAYAQLAEAAETEEVTAYDEARAKVAGAEAGVNTALANLTLLGYGR